VTPGIPDRLLVKGDSPMTKSEVRALILAKLQLEAGQIMLDIGAGTGAVAIEAARLLPTGAVYAIEPLAERVQIIRENAANFGLANLFAVHGSAPEILNELPEADRIFIGGSGGRLVEILEAAAPKLRPGGRIVVSAVTLESLALTVERLSREPFVNFEALAVSLSHLHELNDYHIFKPENPVHLLAADRGEL
jgi:cobalt-precorrin-6B (C15)-methyltransferase